MKWLRVHHDLENEPKIRLVAVESGQIEAVVLAVWVRMMICASQSTVRGTLEGWDDRLVGVTLGLKGSVVTEIREAMQGILLDGDTLPGWEKRQKDKSDDAAARQRKAREKKAREAAKAASGGGHGSNGADSDGHTPVTGQSRDNSVHGHVTSETCHVTPSRATQTLDSEDSEGGDARECAREAVIDDLCLKIEGLTGLDGTEERNRTAVAEWLERGADPAKDILPAITHKLAATQVPIGRIECFGFFRNSVLRRLRQKSNPPPQRPANVHPLRPGYGPRMTSDDAAAHDLLNDLRSSGFLGGGA